MQTLFDLEIVYLQTERIKTITTPKLISKSYMIKMCKYKVNGYEK